MVNVKVKTRRALLGVVAVAALSLAVPAGAGPVTHADDGEYPPVAYGPRSTCGAACFMQSGYWYDSGGYGYLGYELYTYSNGPTNETSFVQWEASGLTPDITYDVCAYIPHWDADASAQYLTLDRFGGNGPFTVDQSRFSDQWAYVTTAVADNSGRIVVVLSDLSNDAPGSTVIGADAVQFVPGYLDRAVPLDDGLSPTQYLCSAAG
jgi:hypothetical protein